MSKGRIIILSGPSGVGKGTILREVMRRNPKLRFSVSATTREPRPGEVEGVHYYFVDKPGFEKMIEEGQLLEHAYYAGNYYGTPEKGIDKALEEGYSVVLEIDVQGALQVLQRRPDAISIFIAPPSFEELTRRLNGRGDTALEVAGLRLHIALQECATATQYQYIIINDDIGHAAEEFQAILTAEACRPQYRTIQLKEEM